MTANGRQGSIMVFSVLTALLSTHASVWAGEPTRTDPHHMLPLGEESEFDRLTPMRWPKPPQIVIHPNTEWRKGGKVERTLTAACRAGRFKEISPMAFRAVYKDDVLGIAFGHGLNLYDPDHLAQRNIVYLFHFGGSLGCQVLSTANLDPQAKP